jgi:glycosyltransferase involved in cell wall biosynthesis
MIGLRILHLVSPCDRSLAAHGAMTLMDWLLEQGHQTALLTNGGETMVEAAAHGLPVLRYDSGRWRWWLKGRREFVQLVNQWNPDVLHVHHLESLPHALLAAHALKLPVIASSDGLEPRSLSLPLHHARVAWVTVPSEIHRAHFISHLRVARDRVTVLPCGVDLRHLSSAYVRNDTAALILGAIGSMIPDSGFTDLIDACACLKREGLAFQAVLIGDGPEAGALREQIASSGLADVVTLEPWQPLNEVMARIDVLVQASIHDQLAPAVLEAMGSGRPVVAVAGGGITDLVHDGRTGLLVPARNPAALSAALSTLAADRKRTRLLGRAARALVAERYDLSLVGQAALELYRSAVSGCATSSARAEGTSIFKRITATHGNKNEALDAYAGRESG